MLPPISSFPADEVWQHLPQERREGESVHLVSFPQPEEDFLDEALEQKWERLWEVREQVTKALEEARQQKVIGHSLDATVRLRAPKKPYGFLQGFSTDLRELFIVSQVELTLDEDAAALTVEIGHAEGEKCQRCWVYDRSVGANKEHPEICQRCFETVMDTG